MKKMLIIQSRILHYRKAFFNELSNSFDLTVIHSGKATVNSNDRYREIITKERKIGPFFVQNKIFKSFIDDKYDIVIAEGNLRYIISILLSIFMQNKCRFGFWGTYLGTNVIVNKFWKYYTKHRNIFHLFYSKHDMEIFEKFNVGENKLFLANNTFHVQKRIKSFEASEKKLILFVGSLDARKELHVLIQAFAEILYGIPSNIDLAIVGDGVENAKLQNQVKTLNLQDRVKFYGQITELEILEDLYKRAYFSVSFGQAGLSVLQSFAYGVPYLTKINSISGGEKYNIIQNKTGFFCQDNIESLKYYMLLLILNTELRHHLSKQCYEHYTYNCSLSAMTDGFINASKLNTNAI
ncbi:MAG: glycosyltransferase [Bacteroidetes bacterium]|nr:glycosyltransferase [Bacteroidota bacterium]